MSENKAATTSIYCQACGKLIKNIRRHIRLTEHTVFTLSPGLINPCEFQKFITDVFFLEEVRT